MRYKRVLFNEFNKYKLNGLVVDDLISFQSYPY